MAYFAEKGFISLIPVISVQKNIVNYCWWGKFGAKFSIIFLVVNKYLNCSRQHYGLFAHDLVYVKISNITFISKYH